MFHRTALKQSLHRIADAKFDARYEEICSRKNVSGSLDSVQEKRWTADQLHPKNVHQHLQINIDLPVRSEVMSEDESLV